MEETPRAEVGWWQWGMGNECVLDRLYLLGVYIQAFVLSGGPPNNSHFLSIFQVPDMWEYTSIWGSLG